jgi:hypothetical protein
MATAVGHEKLRLDEVSLASDSGWRELDNERVDELVAVIMQGSWGMTSLAGPSIVSEGGTKQCSAEDGKFVIFNGKHIVKALLVAREYATAATAAHAADGSASAAVDGTGGSTPAITDGAGGSPVAAIADGTGGSPPVKEWLTDALQAVFSQGLLFTIYEFQHGPYSHLRHRSVQALSHEEEQNKLYHTTMQQLAQLVRAYYVREHSDWNKAQEALTAELGESKASTVRRWTVLARDVSEDVMTYIVSGGLKSMPQKHVVNNKYIVGRGADARHRLSDEWSKVALSWYRDATQSGGQVSAATFVTDYCAVAKQAESWTKAQERIFGLVATGFRAYTRSVEKLKSEHGRRAVLAWLHTAETQRQPHFGLQELVALVAEMQRTKAGTNKSAGSSATGGGAAVDTPAPADSTAGSTAEDPDGDGDALLLDERPATIIDPVLKRAQDLAMSEMAAVSIHTDPTQWADELKSSIYPSSRPLVLVECPTSRMTVFHALLEHLPSIPGDFGLLIPLSFRDELISGVRKVLSKKFPTRPVYMVTMSVGRQSTRVRPSYALYVPPPGIVGAPAHVSIAGCRARASEGIRMRCVSTSCPFRPARPSGTEAAPAGDDDEIPAEDLEEEGFEDTFDQQEEAGAGGNDDRDEEVPVEGACSAAPADCQQNLFPFAAPRALHTRVLHEIGHSHTRTHLVIITRTAHPGAIIAGRDAGLKVIALILGASAHCVSHGAALLKQQMTMAKMSAARQAVGSSTTGVKRHTTQDFQWQVCAAPEEQPILLRDISPSVDNWRVGINCSPPNLDKKAMTQLQHEIDTFQSTVRLEKINGVQIAVASKSLREGDEICCPGGLLFDKIDSLQAFMNTNEHAMAFLGSIVKITNVLEEAGSPADGNDARRDGPKPTTMFFVMTGIGQFFRHYQGVAKQPNVVLSVNVSAGASDGLLRVKVSTRNRCGVAAGAPLVLNYGMEYDAAQVGKAVAGDACKKFRGMLDSYFAKLGAGAAEQAAAAAGETAATAAAGSTALAAASEASGAPPAVPPKAVPPKPAAVPPKPAAVPPKPAAPAAAAEATPPKAGAAVVVTPGPLPEPGSACPAEMAPVLELAAGEVKMADLAFPSVKCTLIFDGTAIRLAATTKLEGNKKIPPRSVLSMSKDGKMVAAAEGLLAFKFDKTKSAIVMHSGQSATTTTLHDLIEQTQAKSVSRHAVWTGGSTPASLTHSSAQTFHYVPKENATFWETAAKSQMCSLGWILKLSDQKVLTPTGIVLYTTKQIIVPASGSIMLT